MPPGWASPRTPSGCGGASGAPGGVVDRGLEPEAGHDIAPPRPRSTCWPIPLGGGRAAGRLGARVRALYGFGTYVSYHAKGTIFDTLDTDVPRWFADRHTDVLTDVSWWWSKFGDTHAILLISLVFCPLVLAVWRRWRPVLFVALAMVGELTLFLASARAVDRPRPAVENLDGQMPTSSFPSGHIAATICVWLAITLIVFPRTDRWWRWIFVGLAVLMPVGVATSRMYRGCTTRPTSWARSCSPRSGSGCSTSSSARTRTSGKATSRPSSRRTWTPSTTSWREPAEPTERRRAADDDLEHPHRRAGSRRPGRLDQVVQVIDEQAPDVLALQELRGFDRDGLMATVAGRVG
ncbi:phosphatase PAP2 family protein [Micromonospora sp. M12]